MTFDLRLYRDPNATGGAAVLEAPAAGAQLANLAPASATASVNLNDLPAGGSFALPDAYKDKPYLKGVDSMDKVYAMLDGAQVLIGKKGPSVPAVDAPQADKDAYYEALGRPKTAAEYKFDGMDKADLKFLPRVQGAFHKHGLTADQAKGVWADVNVALTEHMAEKGIVDQQANVDFTKLATDTFGVDRDKVLARGKELIEANISPAMKPAVSKLDNNSLVVLADVLRNLDKKYIKQDGAPGGAPAASSSTPDDIRAQARLLMEKQKGMSSMSEEFNALQKQINSLYDQLRKK